MNTVEPPKCRRCKLPCEKYGGVGGYSVQCAACNTLSRTKSRERSLRKREEKLFNERMDRVPIPRIFTDYMTVDQVKLVLNDPRLMPTDLTNIRTVRITGNLTAVELE